MNKINKLKLLELFWWFKAVQIHTETPHFGFSFNFSPVCLFVLHMAVLKVGETKGGGWSCVSSAHVWQRSKVHMHQLVDILIPHTVEVPLLHTQFHTAQHNTQRGCTSQWHLKAD